MAEIEKRFADGKIDTAGRHLHRLRRLLVQRAAEQHGAASAPAAGGADRGDGADADRGDQAHPGRVSGDGSGSADCRL